jgi:prepilin-type N-terminal cleavage/methylation domain-containing protein
MTSTNGDRSRGANFSLSLVVKGEGGGEGSSAAHHNTNAPSPQPSPWVQGEGVERVRTSHRGFTMIEMLAATALTALLMIVLLRVIAGLGQSRAALTRDEHRHAWPTSMLGLIRWDLAHAQKWSPLPDGFALEGFGGLDPATRYPDGLPVTVRYEVVASAGKNWLLRRQMTTNRASDTWSEMICADVQSIQLTSLDREDKSSGADRSGLDVPDNLLLHVDSVQADVPPIDQVISLR